MDSDNQNTMLIVEKSLEDNGNGAESSQALERQSPLSELSDSLKDSTLNGNYDFPEDDILNTAPFEILAEFLSALLTRDYKNAFHYCKLILQYEPENVTVQEFYPLIQQKIKNEAELSQSEDSSETSDENSRRDSETSTEYYSSASSKDVVASESESSAVSLSSESEEDDGEEEDDNHNNK